jgi:hypothetical protein
MAATTVAAADVLSARFLSTLFNPSDLVEVRRFPSRNQSWHPASELGSVLLGDKEDAYFGVNPRKGRGGKAENVAVFRCVFVDFDHVADPSQALELIRNADLPAPTAIVFSGRRGPHCYWVLAEPITDAELWRSIQRGLIAALGSDPAIHDPPRIMRLPGSVNQKNGGRAKVVEVNPERVYPADEFPRAAELPRAAAPARTGGGASPANLSRRTLVFLHSGATEGVRNAELFAAACDMAGNGYGMAQAEAELIGPATGCGLEPREVQSAVRSAYGRDRTPAKPPEISPEDVWGHLPTGKTRAAEPKHEGGEWGEVGTDTDRPEPQATSDDAPVQHPPLSNVRSEWEENVRKGKDGKEESKTTKRYVYKSAGVITAEMLAATNGWPKLVGNQPFVMLGDGLEQGPKMFGKPSELFGWLHARCGLHWTEKACSDQSTRDDRTPLTKSEFYDSLCIGGKLDRYKMVSTLPHHPPMPGVYYPPIDLPEPTGDVLEEFVSKFNPATEDDRKLLTALLITPGAGISPGTRPLFVLCADGGQGAGKTSTARAIADVWGGACSLNYEDDWGTLSKRIMSSDDWDARVMLFDNVRSAAFGSGAIESAITEKSITGWKTYVGQVSRPNDATFIVTFNDPSLTRDLTDRAVVIKIGKHNHGFDFVSWANDFVGRHRAALIADCLAVLRNPPQWQVGANADRFQAWQRAVLCRIGGTEGVAKLILDRRSEVDADQEAAIQLIDALRDYDGREVTSIDLYSILTGAGLWAVDQKVSPAQNQANAMKRIKRILSGRQVLAPILDEAGKPVRRVVFDEDRRTTALIWAVDLGGRNPSIPI